MKSSPFFHLCPRISGYLISKVHYPSLISSYIEARWVFFLVGGVHDHRRNQLVFWSSQKKMTDIAQDDEDGVSAHRP